MSSTLSLFANDFTPEIKRTLDEIVVKIPACIGFEAEKMLG
jgi:hypothetical protein